MHEKFGFELLRETELPELNTLAKLYRHRKTGAEFLSLENDDENKVFGITFRTPPEDSTGVAHIMEHSVLCGSRKYPVKEPFVELIKGSLNTFLNAFTYPDKTCYPVASQNLQDFYNLVDVYLDAVFYPALTPFTLQQEGWHYELDSPEGELSFKGVVFNEMKGNYSSSDRLLAEYSQQALFPDNTYAHDSGGDPKAIPDLTWEQFKSFHEVYYHPSNSLIYFYGDDPIEKRFEILNAYLKDFERKDLDSGIALQNRFEGPQYIERACHASENETVPKSMLTVNWMLPAVTDPELMLALGILDHILVGKAASPLRRALIESGLGEDVTGGGLESELRQNYFSTGLKGVAKDNVRSVENLVIDTLSGLAENGIDPDTIAASMNTVEFRLRENNTGSYPRGLLLMLRALSTWLYDGDPFATLSFEAPLKALKEKLEKEPRYFESLIKKHLVDNRHRVTVVLHPDTELAGKWEQEEAARLAEARNGMSEADLRSVIENAAQLRELQAKPDAPEALAKIPVLSLQDLDRKNKTTPCRRTQDSGVTVLHHDLFTNGILYMDLGFDLRAVPAELLPYLSLFSRCLVQIGTEKEDFVRLSQRIGQRTGGIAPSLYFGSDSRSGDARPYLFLRAKGLSHQVDDVFAILQDLTSIVKFDNQDRFRQMVLEEKAGLEAGLIPGGHGVVNTRLKSFYSQVGWLGEMTGGIEYLFFLRNLAEEIETDWPKVLQRLQRLSEIVFTRSRMLVNSTMDAGAWETVEPAVREFLASLGDDELPFATWPEPSRPQSQGLTLPAQVNYVGKGGNLYKMGYAFHGSLLVINKFLRTTWLWEKVRVQGGAYGGFSTFDRRSGFFSFLSYRDPNVLQTLNTYDATAGFLRETELSEQELTKSIIGAIGDIDSYQLPDARGFASMARFISGDSDDDMQRIRDEVLSTGAEHFRAFALTLENLNREGTSVILGAEDDIRAAETELPEPIRFVKIL